MAKSIAHHTLTETIVTGVVAGAAGGLAEIAWVGLYSGVTGGNAAVIAKAVTTAAGVDALFPGAAAGGGVAVHMILSIALGVALACVWRQCAGARWAIGPCAFSLAALLGVWCINFFAILPLVSPAFTHLLPYAVSLTSKLLFGAAAGQVLAVETRRLPQALAAVHVQR